MERERSGAMHDETVRREAQRDNRGARIRTLLEVGMGVRDGQDVVRMEGGEGEKRVAVGDQAIANLGATVRSLSSLALFLSKACCRQSSRLLQL